jgi:hypothetical protein
MNTWLAFMLPTATSALMEVTIAQVFHLDLSCSTHNEMGSVPSPGHCTYSNRANNTNKIEARGEMGWMGWWPV